jgi:hypothetical protein
MIEPEDYNQYGEIVEKIEPVKPYMRTMSAYDQHRIHDTKDLFDSDCTYCQDSAKKIQKYWKEQEELDAES